MIIESSIVSNPALFKKFLVDNQISFFDFGCSAGGGTLWTQGVLQQRGMGFDIDPAKLKLADEAGVLCCNYDLLSLSEEKFVEQTIIFHMLEHLFSVDQATAFIRKAIRVSRDRVIIKQPFFDADSQLFHLGLKTYYSHWSGHRNLMTTPDFWVVLDKFRRGGLIKDFVIGYKKLIESSSSPMLHPLDSPINCHDYDPAVHPPKPAEIRFDFPLYYEIQVEIDISGTGTGAIWGHLDADDIAYDSRRGNASLRHAPATPHRASQASTGVRQPDPANQQAASDHPVLFIRDDDFVEITPNFERLEAIARAHGPIMLAAIPGNLRIDKADGLRLCKNFTPVQHGYRHVNHATGPEKSEFPATRARTLVEGDLVEGRTIMQSMFGLNAGEHFVAPWNRFAREHLDVLEEMGYKSYQGFGSVSFHNNIPMVGYCINFTSVFHECQADYSRILSECKNKINNYMVEYKKRLDGDRVFLPINTHHLMMDALQFAHLERLCMDLQDQLNLRFGSAQEALKEFSTYADKMRA